MSGDAHIIEIESIALDGVDLHHPDAVRALVEAETRRALLGVGLSGARGVAGSEAAVAAEVARSVERAIQGGVGDA
jgi:hypothetical protein